ncbi:MAG: hypothetical protein R2797_06225 [Gelidibacter sp.]
MSLVIISLILSLIITSFGIFSNEDNKTTVNGVTGKSSEPVQDEKKGKFRLWCERKGLNKKNLILLGVNILALGVSYLMIHKEAEENDVLQKNIEDSKMLIKTANDRLSDQQKEIFDGFKMLERQLKQQGSETSAISGTLAQLTNDIKTYSSESKGLINSLNKTLTSESAKSNVGDVVKSGFSIPVGGKSAVIIDAQNQVAITYESKTNYIKIILNGRAYNLRPAQERPFTDENGVDKLLVYQGISNGQHHFTIKSK